MGLLATVKNVSVSFLVFFVLLLFLPALPPQTTFPFTVISIPPLKELKGPLEVNSHLDKAEHLFEGKLLGPVSFLKQGDDIYASVRGGDIVHINGDQITRLTKIGQPCKSLFDEERCGRPLGLEFDTQGDNLIVADAYHGIYQVDVKTGAKVRLVSPDTQLSGHGVNRKARLFKCVAVAKNGDIYWTESTSDFALQNGLYSAFVNPSGRLFHYNRQTRRNTLLLDHIWFASGVVLSPDEEFVLVAELFASQIRRVWLRGPKAGSNDIFTDGLPGLLEHLNPAGHDGLWVPLVQAADEQNPALTHLLAGYPLIRRFIARVLALVELPFQLVENVLPNPVTQRLAFAIGNFQMTSFLRPARATIVRLDWTGNITDSLHGFDRSVFSLSHVVEDNGYLYLGSPYSNFIGRVKLPKKLNKLTKSGSDSANLMKNDEL